MQKLYSDPEQRRKMIEAIQRTHLGKVNSPETRAKMAASKKGKKRTAEQRERMKHAQASRDPMIAKQVGEKLRGRKQDPSIVAKRTSGIQATRDRKRAQGIPEHTPEGRERFIAAGRARWGDADWRANQTAAATERANKPSVKENVSKSAAAQWANPESRARLIAGMKARLEQKRLQQAEQPGQDTLKQLELSL